MYVLNAQTLYLNCAQNWYKVSIFLKLRYIKNYIFQCTFLKFRMFKQYLGYAVNPLVIVHVKLYTHL